MKTVRESDVLTVKPERENIFTQFNKRGHCENQTKCRMQLMLILFDAVQYRSSQLLAVFDQQRRPPTPMLATQAIVNLLDAFDGLTLLFWYVIDAVEPY